MLDEAIEKLLNNIGAETLDKLADMARTELFRNHCIQNYNWFKGGVDINSEQYLCERTWMRFYIDHGRLPANIDFDLIASGKIEEKDIRGALLDVYDAYKKQYGFDILEPDAKIKTNCMQLKGF